jgi:UDP-N-acetylglucosamine 2-epimerase (non-hydrolysing)
MIRIINVVGARPNFMKVAPVMHEMLARKGTLRPLLVHTGQHYDESMNDAFFRELDIPAPDVNLEVGSASHGRQTAQIMTRFESIVEEDKPDWVVVVGDVNSTMAAALVAAKMNVRIAHIEAGLRSYDRTMPEEINRIVTDALSDLLLTPSPDANDNLAREGIPAHKIRFVGNVMIDTLHRNLDKSLASGILSELGLTPGGFGVVTLHRPSNVDSRSALRDIISALSDIQKQLPLVFPMHPRTRSRLTEFGLMDTFASLHGITILPPLGYLDFLRLYSQSRLVLTDSGGVQEETTALGIPCLTLRENTERPITVTQGTNRIVGNDPDRIRIAALEAITSARINPVPPELWDGHAAKRIVDAILEAHIGLVA